MTKSKALATLDQQLALFDQARSALAEARTVDEFKVVSDRAALIEWAVKRAGHGLELQNDAAEIRLRAERAAGAVLAGDPDFGPGRPGKGRAPRPFLQELGISKTQSARYQALAAIPEEAFEGYLTDTRARGGELSATGAVMLSKQHRQRPAPVRRREVARLVDPRWPIYCRDARDFFGDEGSADLAIFSPPYNVGVDYDGDDQADALPHDEWCELLSSVGKVLADGWGVGRICVNTPLGIGRKPYQPLLPSVLEAFAAFECEGVILWDKATTGNRTSWGSWRMPTDPSLRDRTEIVTVFRTANPVTVPDGALEVWERSNGSQVRMSPWLDRDGFMQSCQDLWQIAPARRERGGHPAPFPVELPERLIRLFGWPGCTVIDPFAGSGSTGVAALRLGAHVVLIDKSEAYVDLMHERLQAEARGSADTSHG